MEQQAYFTAVDYDRIFISMLEYDMGQILGTTNKPGEEFKNIEPKQSKWFTQKLLVLQFT
jgi:hypothetical protein